MELGWLILMGCCVGAAVMEVGVSRIDRLLAPYDRLGIPDTAHRVLRAWPEVSTSWQPDGTAPRNLERRWRWIWEHLLIDYGQLSVLTGLDRKEAAEQLQLCALLRLVYPDGSISDLVKHCMTDDDEASA